MTTQILYGKHAFRFLLLLTMLQTAVQAQNRFLRTSNTDSKKPPSTWCPLLDTKKAEQLQRVYLSKNASIWQEFDSLWSAKRMPQGLSRIAAIRGVEWIKQDRVAVYNQPGEFIRVEVKWSSPVAIKGMRINTETDSKPQLYDDGTHGDRISGDGIWTLDSFSVYGFPGSPRYQWYRNSKYGRAVCFIFPIECQLSVGPWESDG